MKKAGKQSQRGGAITTLVALLLVALLLLGIYLVRHPLLRFAGEQLIEEDPLEKSDAIVILSGDNYYADRATRAAEVFRQGLAPVVVASGARLRPYAGISELMTHDLIERGVPKEKIIPFPHDADNTGEGKILGDGITVRMASAPDGDFDPANWYDHRKSIKRFVHEVAGLCVAMWELHGEHS